MKLLLHKLKTFIMELDLILLGLSVACSGIGLIFVLSATKSYSNTTRLMIIQAAAIVIGLVGMVIISRFDFENLTSLSRVWFGLGILALVVVLIIGVGAEETGNQSWIRFGPIGVQPSEFVKILFAISFAAHLAAVKDHINHPKNLVFVGLHSLIIIGLVMMQGDLGSALVFIFMTTVMLYLAGISLWYFLGAGVACFAALPLIWNHVLSNYHRKRILVVLYPELDPVGFGYQASQCKTAIGSGQIWGRGYMQGLLTQYDLIPAKHTDCIFAVIGEEGGLLCCLLVVGLLTALVVRCFLIARKARTTAGFLCCVGIGCSLLFQAAVNIGMNLGIMPVIGITLPFFSYGGSSIVASFWALGVVMCVHRNRRDIHFGEK